jgi:hypothetical protein
MDVTAPGQRIKRVIARCRGVLPGVDVYVYCVATLLILPLAPMAIEWLIQGSVSERTGFISAAMYAISIGISSTWRTQYGIGVISSLIFSALFGLSFAGSIPPLTTQITPLAMSLMCIGLFFAIHALERFIRHVIWRQPFPAT